jgi:hypothetical protein
MVVYDCRAGPIAAVEAGEAGETGNMSRADLDESMAKGRK